MADISKIKLNGEIYNIKDANAMHIDDPIDVTPSDVQISDTDTAKNKFILGALAETVTQEQYVNAPTQYGDYIATCSFVVQLVERLLGIGIRVDGNSIVLSSEDTVSGHTLSTGNPTTDVVGTALVL